MCESRWTYYDPYGGIQIVGMYHGHDSGNVAIYHNSEVVTVDFRLHRPKTYSFMINDNLCQIEVLKDNGEYRYEFEARNVSKSEPASLTDKMKSLLRVGWLSAFTA